jgi:hypothetical protein
MTTVEISNYRAINKGSLKASFTLKVLPIGFIFSDCKHFKMTDKEWFNFPQKEVKGAEGVKPKYFPLVKIDNDILNETIKELVLEALRHEENNGAHNSGHSQPPADKDEFSF